MVRGLARWVIAIALVLLSPRAWANELAVELVVDRGPGAEACPDATRLAAGVVARLGVDPFVAPGAHATERVECQVRATFPGLRAVVRVLDGPGGTVRGERIIESSQRDCAELAAAIELTVTITLGQGGAPAAALVGERGGAPGDDGRATPVAFAPAADPGSSRATSEPGAGAVAAGPSSGGAASAIVAPGGRGAAAKPPPWRLAWAFGAAATAGFAPGVSGSAVVEVGLGRGRWSGSLRALVQPESTIAVGLGRSGEVAIQVAGAGALSCRAGAFASVCAVAEVDRVAATPAMVPAGRAGVGARLGAGLVARWEVPVAGPWFLRADAELQIELVGAQILLGDEVLWASPVLAGRAGVAVGVRY